MESKINHKCIFRKHWKKSNNDNAFGVIALSHTVITYCEGLFADPGKIEEDRHAMQSLTHFLLMSNTTEKARSG